MFTTCPPGKEAARFTYYQGEIELTNLTLIQELRNSSSLEFSKGVIDSNFKTILESHTHNIYIYIYIYVCVCVCVCVCMCVCVCVCICQNYSIYNIHQQACTHQLASYGASCQIYKPSQICRCNELSWNVTLTYGLHQDFPEIYDEYY